MSMLPRNEPGFFELERRRQSGARVVFTNGCFDLLHVGHLRYLREAAALGDTLIVGINSDRSVTQLKGPSRPVVTEEERAELLSALEPVDIVLIFDEETPEQLIRAVRPNVLVKGGDWPVDRIVGADFVLASGGVVRSLPYVPGRSTTGLLRRIGEREEE